MKNIVSRVRVAIPLLAFFGLLILLASPKISYASDMRPMGLDEAKEYLLNYEATELNDFGEPITVRYRFNSEEQLTQAAEFIVSNGVDSFHEYIDDCVEENVASDSVSATPFSVNPFTVYRTVSANGTHRLSGTGHGVSNFGKYGSISFTANIGMSVDVKNGKIAASHSPWFNLSYISSGGRMVPGVALPTSCNPGSGASVTANFKIERVIGIAPLDVVVGTSYEVFCLIAQQG